MTCQRRPADGCSFSKVHPNYDVQTKCARKPTPKLNFCKWFAVSIWLIDKQVPKAHWPQSAPWKALMLGIASEVQVLGMHRILLCWDLNYTPKSLNSPESRFPLMESSIAGIQEPVLWTRWRRTNDHQFLMTLWWMPWTPQSWALRIPSWYKNFFKPRWFLLCWFLATFQTHSAYSLNHSHSHHEGTLFPW